MSTDPSNRRRRGKVRGALAALAIAAIGILLARSGIFELYTAGGRDKNRQKVATTGPATSDASSDSAPYDTLIRKGNRLLNDRKLAEACAAGVDAVALDPNRFEGYALQSMSQQQQGNQKKASALVDVALALAPESKITTLRRLKALVESTQTTAVAATSTSEPTSKPISNDVGTGRLGISIFAVQRILSLTNLMGYHGTSGAIVTRIAANTPADGSLMVGDILLAVDGQPLSGTSQTLPLAAGVLSRFTVWRDQKVLTLDITPVIEKAIPATVARRTYKNSIGMSFISIGPAIFQIGSPKSEAFREADESPRMVFIRRKYSIGAYEVTRGNFAEFANSEKYVTDAERAGLPHTWRSPGFEQTDAHPVVCVSWNDSVKFCQWLSKIDGKKYRLPTEAEWEFACRGDAGVRPFAFPKIDASSAQFDSSFAYYGDDKVTSAATGTAPVGSFSPNGFGIYDMHGNGAEWCSDWYAFYPSEPAVDPIGPNAGDFKVVRGGSWFHAPQRCRTAARDYQKPDISDVTVGFRALAED